MVNFVYTVYGCDLVDDSTKIEKYGRSD